MKKKIYTKKSIHYKMHINIFEYACIEYANKEFICINVVK